MKIVSALLQLLLVVTATAALIAVGVVAGLGRSGVAQEISDAALRSPEARAEIAADISNDLISNAPVLANVPGIDALVLAWVESPSGTLTVREWVDHGVRSRLGQSVEPLRLQAGDIVQTNNALVDGVIASLPPVELQPASPNGSLVATATTAFLVVLALAAGSYLGVRYTAGRARAAMVGGFGGLTAAVVLFMMPIAAPALGALPAIAAASIITPTSSAAIASISGLIILRAFLAETGKAPYRSTDGISRAEQGSFDLDFVVLD